VDTCCRDDNFVADTGYTWTATRDTTCILLHVSGVNAALVDTADTGTQEAGDSELLLRASSRILSRFSVDINFMNRCTTRPHVAQKTPVTVEELFLVVNFSINY